MQTTAVWEDEDHNRKVTLRVKYELEAAGVTVVDTTPIQIEFPLQNRSVQIWTRSAQEMLLRQLHEAGEFHNLVGQVEDLLAVSAS